ncbi:C-type lectin domain family 17, member A-like isoform X2 [Phalacrocorax carbo]|uniref:C-type lectin domain family 17, member A-like isoform X2 n=1 Tax=Phalacrocorax carbo TaxID=9209 RepID=UPI0031192B4E
MAQQETYGNWLGPPPAPTKRLVRQAGIYSVAGKMTPMADFRPASPDSFEDDYDDVSLPESGRGHKPLPVGEDLRSPKSKGGVYILAGKPPSPTASQQGDPELGGGGERSRCATSVVVLYVLVGLSFVAWALLFALAAVKQMEIMEELKVLRLNYSENEANAWRELSEARRERAQLRAGMRQHHEELRDVAVLICRTIPDGRKCSAGWKTFERSCYSFSAEAASWSGASDACAGHGAHLVIVDSDPEQFLKDTINSSGTYWLGVRRAAGGAWLWASGQEPTVSYWSLRRGGGGRLPACGSIGPGGLWEPDGCSRAHPWICEKSWDC